MSIFLISLQGFGNGYATGHYINVTGTVTSPEKNPKQQKGILANTPPELTSSGNQLFCPGVPINVVTSFNITDPDDTAALAVYIQISSGYAVSQDVLYLTGAHPAVIGQWDNASGKLTLKSPASILVSYTDLIAAVQDVMYNNTSPSASGSRTFSISIGEANYLPSTGHYYEFVPSLGITWSNAKTAAAASTYYGLQGYLATIGAADEAQLSGKQASGAGWIGGTDEETEGVWKWVTGPENGTVFWNGLANGSSPNFAFWNTSEPNNLDGEHYAHITAPGVGIPGSWNDLSNVGGASGDYQPKGYIVEYGGMPGDPTLNIATSTTLTIPKITSVVPRSNCGPGQVTLEATANAGTVKWYDRPIGGTLLATGTNFTTPVINTDTTYYADAAETGCTGSTRTAVVAKIIQIPNLIVPVPASACEGRITLSASTDIGQIRWYDMASGGTLLSTGPDYTATLSASTTFYVDAVNSDCLSGPRVAVTQVIIPSPVVNDEELPICENGTLRLDAGISNVTYLWSTGSASKAITVDAPGTYTVDVTNAGNCTSTKTFTVTEKAAPVINDVLVNGNAVTINMANNGSFEYSVDGINFQESNVFTVDNPGKNTAYVHEKHECGLAKKDFIVIVIPNFFSPNNDSHNDVWTILGMVFYPEASVTIFDRYGKLVSELNKGNLSWNGTFNGLPLPSSDYWYVIKIDSQSPEVRGHFSLVR